MNKKIIFLSLLGFFWANIAKAVCPICVVAVGAGLGFSEWLGVDDVVASIWIGALLLATVLWTLLEMRKRNKKFAFDSVIIFLAYYLLTLVPLYYAGIIGHPLNVIFGIDKIIFGATLGTLVLLFSHWLNLYLREKNGGKVFFNYQKVVIPIIILLLVSVIFYLITK